MIGLVLPCIMPWQGLYAGCQMGIHRWLILQLGLALALACGTLLGLVTTQHLGLLVVMLFQSTEENLPQQARAEVLQLGVAVVHQVTVCPDSDSLPKAEHVNA